jgi:hypothetical protein
MEDIPKIRNSFCRGKGIAIMITIPEDVLVSFDGLMEKRAVPIQQRPDYRKWLRYFLDFRSKYALPESRSDQVRLFIEKLRSKGQMQQLGQAAQAVSVYFTMKGKEATTPADAQGRTIPLLSGAPMTSAAENEAAETSATGVAEKGYAHRSGYRYDEVRFRKKTGSPEWDKVVEQLEAEIATRHYSRRTLITYANWSRKFQHYLKNKLPSDLAPSDVKAYLTHLALECKVASSTQNQAFNAILLFYRHLRTIQTLLGRAELRTTMIYTHCVPSRTVKEAMSPLDF